MLCGGARSAGGLSRSAGGGPPRCSECTHLLNLLNLLRRGGHAVCVWSGGCSPMNTRSEVLLTSSPGHGIKKEKRAEETSYSGCGAGGGGRLGTLCRYMEVQISIRQHTSANVSSQHTDANLLLSIRQHTSAYVSCQHTSVYVSICQHTSAYVSIRQQSAYGRLASCSA